MNLSAPCPASLRFDAQRRRLLGAAAGLALSPAFAAAAGEASPPAPPPFDTLDFDWIDTARSRAVPARLYWPQAAQAKLPLVVFSHGIGGSRQGYSYLGRHWASHGWASLHVQHVGSDSALWRGSPFQLVDRLRAAAQESEAIARAQDLHFALDRLQALPLASQLDTQRTAVAGHSYGANTALLAVGARVERHQRWLQFRDPRFHAAVIISAPPFYGERDLASVLSPVAVPTLHVTATGDVIEIPGYQSGAADRIAVFEAVADPRKRLVVYDGGSHSMFTDRGVTGGWSFNPKVKAATKDLTLAFFRQTFDGDDAALPQWSSAWHDIVARQQGLRPA